MGCWFLGLSVDIPVSYAAALRLDIGGSGTNHGDPTPHGFGVKLRAIVGAHVGRHNTKNEEIRVHINDVGKKGAPSS